MATYVAWVVEMHGSAKNFESYRGFYLAAQKTTGDPEVTAGANIHHKYPVFGTTPYSFPKHLTFPQTYSHQSPWPSHPAGSYEPQWFIVSSLYQEYPVRLRQVHRTAFNRFERHKGNLENHHTQHHQFIVEHHYL